MIINDISHLELIPYDDYHLANKVLGGFFSKATANVNTGSGIAISIGTAQSKGDITFSKTDTSSNVISDPFFEASTGTASAVTFGISSGKNTKVTSDVAADVGAFIG